MATTYPMTLIPARDLQLGDVVDALPHDTPWSTATVTKITDDSVQFHRPYGHTEDWSYTGGVIFYTGLEVYTVPRNDKTYYVYTRKEVK